jgi:hypothetical protein
MSYLLRLVGAVLFLSGAIGCTAYPAPRNAHFVHSVFFKFPKGLEPPKAREFLADVRDSLVSIPTVDALWIGRPAPTRSPDRPMVDTNYDFGMVLLFADQKALQEYLDHPDHVAFAKKWDAVSEVRVYDFQPYQEGEEP